MSVPVRVAAVDFESFIDRLQNFSARQLPYAASLAMNRAAQDGRDSARKHVSAHLNILNRGLLSRLGPTGKLREGARTGSNGWSSKKQWPNLSVTFFTAVHSLALHETGGVKPGRSSNVWIRDRGVARKSTGGVPDRYQPSKLKRKMSTVSAQTGKEKKQSRDTRVFAAVDRKGRTTIFERNVGTNITRPLYHLRPLAVIKDTLDIEGQVVSTFLAKIYPRFKQSMDEAIRDPKKAKNG